MTGYRVDLSRLADIVAQIARFDQRLEVSLTDVQGQVDGLHATWSGAAAQAHQQAYAKWTRGVADMRAALAEMRRNAQIAHDNYTSAAMTNAHIWEQAL